MGFIEGLVYIVIAYWVAKFGERVFTDIWYNFVMRPIHRLQEKKEYEEYKLQESVTTKKSKKK